MSFMEEFDHLKIKLEDVMLATENFGPNKLIGRGGFGLVYQGELSLPEGRIAVACKRLDSKYGQGNVEFWKEVMMLSKYKHENLVSLLYFCIEDDERILVYEYAPRGSLDRYLSDVCLTWSQRLKICIGVAHALAYLHDPMETQQRVLHRDIKSSNILLDEEWTAKVSDFGLSKIGPANQPQTYIVSNAVGTPGYCDPLYWEIGFLSKESDVYSFGVVLFEVMCGTLCCEYDDGGLLAHILVNRWKKCFDENRLDDIVCHGLKEDIESGSLKAFSNIAFRCLQKTREERPTMDEIVQELEFALEQQELFDDIRKRRNFVEMGRIAGLAVPPLSDIPRSQLLVRFAKGIFVDDGKTWFWVNKKGEHCEFIFVEKCIPADDKVTFQSTYRDSRFGYLYEHHPLRNLRLRLTTQFLSPCVTYIINLVYKRDHDKRSLRVPLKYKLEEMTQYLTSCVAHLGEDGFLRSELFQFTCKRKKNPFNIEVLSESMTGLLHLKGIEFLPVDFEKDENVKDENEIEANMQQMVTYSDYYWEGKLLDDYTDLDKLLKDVKYWMTQKEVYFLLRRGLLIHNAQLWFSISKTSKKRHMLPAKSFLHGEASRWNFLSGINSKWRWRTIPGSR